MATSGRIETSRFSNYTCFYIQWQLAGQDIGGNFSRVNWQAGINIANSAWWGSNAVRIWGGGINGQAIGTGTWSNLSGNGDKQLLAGTFDIPHNADGTKSFYFDIGGGFYDGTNGSNGAWSELPTIPRTSQVSLSKTRATIGEPITAYSNRKANVFLHNITFQVPDENIILRGWNFADAWTATPTSAQIDEIYSKIPNSREISFGVDMDTFYNGNKIGSTYQNGVYVIDTNACLPDPADFTFKDTNSATVAITGNNQVFIQNNSTVDFTIPADKKAIAKKYATIKNYIFNFQGSSIQKEFSAEAITATGGLITTENPTVQLTALDSRSLTATATKTLTVIPYQKPQINATAKRIGSYEDGTKIKINATYSPIKISNTPKNDLTAIRYRYADTEGGAWSDWQTRSFTKDNANGTATMPEFTISLKNTKTWTIEIEATDRLNTVKTTVQVDAGISIFHISTADRKVYNNDEPLMPSHIGMIIHSKTLDTPEKVQAKYGGKWVAEAMGRVLIGVGSNGQTNYASAGIEGGSDNITLTTSQLPKMAYEATFHGQEHGTPIYNARGNLDKGGLYGAYQNGTPSGGGAHSRQLAIGFGNDQPHENRQPFVSVYIWQRIL